jgi:hypothetical protein
LRLQATCLADLPVTLHHSGMMFNAHTDAEGMLAIVVPSLAENAVFIAAFDNGFGAAAATSVPDVTKYERIVVQWQGRSGIELHALEFDADYNSAGHVWSSAQRDPQVAIQGQGGFITMLGDQLARDSRIAEVYSFPAGHARRSGAVNLSVEAEITAANCGQDVSAQTIEYRSGGPLKVQDIQLFMPGCDTIGDFLVLKNVLEDLKIASN